MSVKREKLKDAAESVSRAIYDLKVAGFTTPLDDLCRVNAKIIAELDHMDAVKDHPQLL